MTTVLGNIDWMLINFMLALMGVYAGWAYLAAKEWFAKLFFGILWFAFVPNTIYILTDIKHIPRQLPMTDGTESIVLLLQYAFFITSGAITFLLAMIPIEQRLRKVRGLNNLVGITLVFLNFLIAFGVTMGRFQRTNSWYIISDTQRVIDDALATLTSPGLLLYIFTFGLICNALYFTFRRPVYLLFTVLKLDHKKRKK
jgi:uncharacterized membrane protein